jgi:hypothetical protein
MVDPSAFNQIEKQATDILIKILIPLWIVLSVAVSIWAYKSTRAKVFWKNLYRSVFPPREPKKGAKKPWFRR